MKKILITGENSYIGKSFINWVARSELAYNIEELCVRDEGWKQFDFSSFDVVFHVAGIAHVSTKKSMEDMYFKVNRDLTVDVAKKAKECGVKQFIFMSSAIVYGHPIDGRVDANVVPNPVDFYGKSKLEAEIGIQKLNGPDFIVTVLRPPMIYGPNSKGNFMRLANASVKVKVFPTLENKRSMLFIDNLCISLDYLIDTPQSGVFFPQNPEYVSTSNLVRQISAIEQKRIHFTSLFNGLLRMLRTHVNVFNKVFGDFYYVQEMSQNLPANSIDFVSGLNQTMGG